MRNVLEGKVLGNRYKIQVKIGNGGMASVYRGIDTTLNRTIAIKVMHPQYAGDHSFAARFRQEAQAAAGLSNPYIVNIYDWGQDGDTYYIIMEYLSGTDLKTGIRTQGTIACKKAAQIGAQVCSALSNAHAHEIIHRDIKPQNIMILPDGSSKVMDFGIARGKDSNLTQTNSVLGTAHYVSPEQTQGLDLGPASDIYSLGIVLYECVTGKVPFDGDSAITVALKQVNEEPIPPSQVNPHVDAAFEAIILKAMQKDPAMRFQSANEMRQALNAYISGANVGALGLGATKTTVMTQPTATMPNVSPAHTAVLPKPTQTPDYSRNSSSSSRKKPLLIALVSLLAVLIIGGLVYALVTHDVFGSKERRPVPNLIGLDKKAAVKSINDSGYEVGNISTQFSDQPVDTVIDQDPDPDAVNPSTNKINLVLSGGNEPAKEVVVPDLKGMSVTDAEQALKALKLVPKVGEAVHDSKVETGKIATQTPAAGTKIMEGDTVTYSLSLGSETVEIPNVVGEDLESATAILKEAGFAVESNEQKSNKPKGQVITQSPGAGGKADKGSTIKLVVSSGSPKVKVPNVVGMSLSDAEKALANAGFRYDSSGEASDLVQSQSPAGGTTADQGTTIHLEGAAAPRTPPGNGNGNGHNH